MALQKWLIDQGSLFYDTSGACSTVQHNYKISLVGPEFSPSDST